MQRHHRCRQNHHHPNRFYEELQVLGCKSWSHRSIDVLDILSVWSSADLCDVAWFATVEAKTTTRVFLHWVGAVQVHRLGGWRHHGSGRLGEGGCGSDRSDNRRGAEQGWLSGGSLWLGVSESPPLVVEQGGLAFPLCPSGWHRLEPVDALSEAGGDRLLEPIHKAYMGRLRDGSMDLEPPKQFLYWSDALLP